MGTLWDKWTKKKKEDRSEHRNDGSARRQAEGFFDEYEPLTEDAPKPKPVEQQIENPLKLKVGGGVEIDTVDLSDFDFVVESIREVRRQLEGKNYPIIDYDLVAHPLGKEAIKKRLRLVPKSNPDGKHTHDVILLNYVDQFAYDEGYHKGLAYEENQGEALEGEDKFSRVQDVKSSWTATTHTVLGGSGPVEGELEYWDFWRDTKDADQQDAREFYYVELQDKSLFEVWRGFLLDQSRIVAI